MHEFFLRINKVLRGHQTAEADIQEMDVVCKLLLALPKSYDALVMALETTQQKQWTMEYVREHLRDEQMKQVHSRPASDRMHLRPDSKPAVQVRW